MLRARLPAHLHADLQEDHHHAGILADGPMALGAHPRVDQDLGHGVAGRRGFLAVVGRGQGADIVRAGGSRR